MSVCDVCGNEYPDVFEIKMHGKSYCFDSFECAIHHLAPVCPHCGCRVIGHGIQAGVDVYCCAHCASHDGEHGAVDNITKAERNSGE